MMWISTNTSSKRKELRVPVLHASVGSSAVGFPGLGGVLPDAWAVRELVLMLGLVTDPRRRRGVRHRLSTVLAVAGFPGLACGQAIPSGGYPGACLSHVLLWVGASPA